MNTHFLAFATALVLATRVFAEGPSQSLHLQVTCDSCTDHQSVFLLEHARTSALASGFHFPDSLAKAPTLRIVIVPVDSLWSLNTSLNSPTGRPLGMSSQVLPPPFEVSMKVELESVLEDAARTIREARQRSTKPEQVVP